MFYVEHIVVGPTEHVVERREWNGHVSDEDEFRDYARLALAHAATRDRIIRLVDELGRELYRYGAEGELAPTAKPVG
jgi:hypothetical protein